MEDVICSHFKHGYCKYKEHCPKQHVNVICPNFPDCDNELCYKRHPKTCKFFARNTKCRFVNCAYSHENSRNPKVEHLEKQVTELKHELEELKKTNEDISKTLGDVVKKMKDFENRTKNNKKKVTIEREKSKPAKQTNMDHETDKQNETKVEIASNKDIMRGTEPIGKRDNNKPTFKCQQCEYECKTKNTLSKHTNTKHGANIEGGNNYSECSLCEEKFDTVSELQKHKEEHIEEIEGIDIAKVTKGHELFQCNLCSFESGHEDSIREHMIDHVNYSIKDQKEYSDKKSLLDEYDEAGNYIGDDPNLMDSDDQEYETDDDN